jgi:hypothetical protein
MTGQELQTTQVNQAVITRETVAGVKARVQLVQSVMRGVMKEGTHYGVIPGTKEKSLRKPGAEILGLTFQFAPRYAIEDLSELPEVVRYRIQCDLYHQEAGTFIGSGHGEASSDEDKYRWRKAVCEEEFEATPEDRRRVKWAKGQGGSTYSVRQVRMEPADIANTVLKMAEKRSFVDAIRTATACSDMFAQDLEDLPSEVREAMTGEEKPQPKPIGAADYKKLLRQAKKYGYSEADVLATAATAGHEGDGPGIPEDLAQRLFHGMKDHPRVQPKPEPPTADPETGEIEDTSSGAEATTNGAYRTPLMGDE